jgi:hypothetical protein
MVAVAGALGVFVALWWAWHAFEWPPSGALTRWQKLMTGCGTGQTPDTLRLVNQPPFRTVKATSCPL